MRLATLAAAVFVVASRLSTAETILVPEDYPTIQAGIDAAVDGDTVVVGPGTYPENISFLGKGITVTSAEGPSVTIIDGNQASTVVLFEFGEPRTAVLNGFTIQNGLGSNDIGLPRGGGIYLINGSAPKIVNNIIRANNSIDGAGIYCTNRTSPVIANNLIVDNTAVLHGGGIWLDDLVDPRITNNTIVGNAASSGGGIYLQPTEPPQPILNCILWGNLPHQISGPVDAAYCNIQGGWSGDGNINEDPLFIDPTNDDFHIDRKSPSVNAGNNKVPFGSPEIDFDGEPRVADYVIDMGFDEYNCMLFGEFGEGLGGTLGYVPELFGTGGSCDIGRSWINFDFGLGAAGGFLWVGGGEVDIPFFGGHLYVDPSSVWLLIPFALDGLPGWPGGGYLNLPLPDLSGSGGLVVYLQGSFFDPAAPEGFHSRMGWR